MSIARKVLSNTASQVAGKVGMAVVSIVTVKLITNYLGLKGYGQYAQVYEFLALFGIFSDLGLFTIAVREISKDETKAPYILGNIFSVRIIAAAIAMILAVISVFLIPKYQGTYVPLGVAISSIGVFLSIFTGTISSILQVHLKMQQATIALVMGRIVSLSYIVFAVFKFKNNPEVGFAHLMWAGVAGSILMTALTWYYARKLTEIKPRFDFDFWREVVWKSLPYGIALILNTVYFRINAVLLFYIKGPEEAGLFAVPLKIVEILSVVSIYFMNSVLPVLTKKMGEINSKEGKEKANQIIQYCFDFLTACGLPIVAGAVMLAYPITYLISSKDFLSRLSDGFYGSDMALQIIIFALFFSYINNLFGVILIAANKQNQLLWTSSGCVLFNIIFNLITIPRFGFRGAALTSVASELFILITLWLMSQSYFNYKINLKGAGKAFISALSMALFLWLARDSFYQIGQSKSILLLVPLGALCYTVMMFVTKGITKEMIKTITK